MRVKTGAFVFVFFVAIAGVSVCFAGDRLMKPSLEPSFELTAEGLSYAVYGKSIVSQGRLFQHSPVDLRDLPEGASIVKAFLYWAGEVEPQKAADTTVELKDPEGKISVVQAGKVWTDVVSGLVYVSRAEVGDLIRKKGIYEISSIDADPLESATIAGVVKKKARYTLGGWGLIVVFKDPGMKRRASLTLYDGLLYIPSGDAKREGKYGLQSVGGDVPKEVLYPDTVFKIKSPEGMGAVCLDLALLCGLGKPWDGGSVSFDGVPLSGREDFAGSAGFSWDVSRDILFLDKAQAGQHQIEFIPDYNSIMPVAIVAKFGAAEDAEILRLAASYMKQAGDLDGMEFFDRADSSLEEREFLAKDYIKENLKAKAVELFKKVSGRGAAGSAGLHAALGKLYLEQDNLDLAEMELKETARLGKDNGAVYLWLGQLYYEKRDIEEAIRWLTEAKKRLPGNPGVFQNLGMCNLQKGLSDAAISDFEEAIRLDPKNPAPYRFLLGLYESQGRVAKKVAVLKRMEALEHSDSR